ncbi:hypothetical protein B0H19DRAFT_8228, partial [Mycena capillaripes]
LDGIGPFNYPGLWAVGSLHSTATLSIQSAPAACMCLGACTVSIFSSSTTATRLGGPSFLRPSEVLTLTLIILKYIALTVSVYIV